MAEVSKDSKRITAIITTTVLVLLMASSPFIGFSSSIASTVNASGLPASVSQAGDYGDIMQYEWPTLGSDDGNTRFNPGPAPDKPELLWTSAYGSVYTVFNGKAFTTSGGYLNALDAFTGDLEWRTPLRYPGSSNPNKIDDTYLFVDHGSSYASDGGVTVYRISDGIYISHVNMTSGTIVGWNNPGGGSYYPGKYSPELKMKYRVAFDTATGEMWIIAADLSNPLNPTVAWRYKTDKTSEIMTTGDGKVFIGSYSGHCMYALDGKNGTFLWKSPKIGICGYTATYYNGAVYHSGGSTRLTAYNASTGKILWDYDAGVGNWFAHGTAAAYGRIYQHIIVHLERPAGVPNGLYVCWDAETGDVLWKTETNYMGGYWTPAVADGKVYAMVVDPPNWAASNPLPLTWAALDAFTGSILWKIPGRISDFIVAYGNLYAGRTVIGPSDPPKPWSYFRGNLDNPGLAIGQSSPSDLSIGPKWTYKTGGAVTSSPAVVDGKVYIGSYDKNIYCLDAKNGSLVWEFPTEYEVSSSLAVVGDRVYTGADDGYIYALDADTGDEVWKTNIYGGNVPSIQFEIDNWQVRSSPIIVGGGLYVGALDGNVYCLSKENGNILWTFPTGFPIGGSPTYADGVIYIASTDRNVYALDASNGNKIWNWTTPKTARGSRQMFLVGTPTVAEGKVFIGGGGRSVSPRGPILVALNATTGEEVWTAVTDPEGNSNQPWAATYFNGVVYAEAHMSPAAFNATNGELIWRQWVGHQIQSSPAYADDPQGAKVYYGSNSYSITAFDAATGEPLSWFTTEGQVVSSPAIYDSKLYVGSVDQKVYCFDDTLTVPTNIWAVCSKGATCWSNETVVISGQLAGTTTGQYWESLTTLAPTTDYGLQPGIPDTQILVTFTKPDGTQVDVTTTTDEKGYFSISYIPSVAGNWSWTAWCEVKELPHVSYSYAYTDDMPLKVVSEEEPTNGGEEPPPEGIPTEYIYAIVAVIAIVIIAVAAYAYMKRGKK